MSLRIVDPDPDYGASDDRPPEDFPFNAINTYLLDRITLLETVQKLAAPIDELYDDGCEIQASMSLRGTWAVFNAIIPQIPYDHQAHVKLAQLIVGLKNRPSPTHNKRKFDDMQHVLWADLPYWRPKCRHTWAPAADEARDAIRESLLFGLPPEGLEQELSSIQQGWTRCNAFVARLTTIPGAPDYEVYAIHALRWALEVKDLSPQDIGMNVPAAAVWISYAGEWIYSSQREWDPLHSEGHADPAHGGTLWNGKKGFCSERWALWKESFRMVAENDAVIGEARQFARRAVEKMTQIEES